jgi:general secretion pathway protein I
MKNSKQKQYFDDHKGFTLIEVMIALSIIAIVFMAVFRMQSQNISMSRAAVFHAVSPLLARKKAVEIESSGKGQVEENSGEFGDENPGYHWTITVSDMEEIAALGETGGDLKKIDIQVSLGDDEFVYNLRTYSFLPH